MILSITQQDPHLTAKIQWTNPRNHNQKLPKKGINCQKSMNTTTQFLTVRNKSRKLFKVYRKSKKRDRDNSLSIKYIKNIDQQMERYNMKSLPKK